MAKIDTNPTGYVLVAIDISKNRHDILIAAPDKKRRRRVTLMNTFEDYRRLIDLLRDYGCPVRIGFEATGNYHRTLVYQLAMAGLELQLIFSVAIARTREALHNSWDKTLPRMLRLSCICSRLAQFRSFMIH